MTPALTQALADSKSVCIMLPKNPYLDQVAAGLSLFLALKDKNAMIYCDTPMTVEFNRLIGVNKVGQTIGNKNLIVKLINYPLANVERVNYDVDGNDLFLAVFPQPGVLPPTKDNVQISYAGVAADTVILIGGANETHFPLIMQKDFLEMKVIHIGVADITLPSRQVLSLSKGSSSISEVIAGYLLEMDAVTNDDIATDLFIGLSEGTKNFTASTVTADTFSLAAKLLEKGARREQMKAFQPKPLSTGAPATNTPQSNTPAVPRSWVEPKIFKGTSTQ